MTLINTIVIGNLSLSGAPSDCATSGGIGIVSEGYNLVGTGSGCPSDGTGDLTTTNPASVLNSTLADNGGPTFTHALVAGSAPSMPAIPLLPAVAATLANSETSVGLFVPTGATLARSN